MYYFRLIGVFILFNLLIIQNACANYIDPGVGSYFVQTLIAVVLAGLFAIKLFWRKIIYFLKNLWKRK
jgi:hypothetical protein